MRPHDRKALPEDLSHGPRSPALRETPRVDAEPGDLQHDGRVEACGHEAGREDLDVDGGGGEEDCVTGDGYGEGG